MRACSVAHAKSFAQSAIRVSAPSERSVSFPLSPPRSLLELSRRATPAIAFGSLESRSLMSTLGAIREDFLFPTHHPLPAVFRNAFVPSAESLAGYKRALTRTPQLGCRPVTPTYLGVSHTGLQRLHSRVSSHLFRQPISARRGTKRLRAKRAFMVYARGARVQRRIKSR